jgi:glycosyltransferase involved in cell wall biosynthesis
MNPLEVVYDGQIFYRQRRGGASRLFVELIREFLLDPDLGIHPTIDLRINRNNYLAELPTGHFWTIPEGHLLDRAGLVGFANRLTSRRLNRGPVIEHFTYHEKLPNPRHSDVRTAVTLLDMIPELHPNDVGHESHRNKTACLQQADLVICISETVRDDLLSCVANISGHIQVCPLGVRPVTEERLFDQRRRRILYVSARSHYKRFGVLVDALLDGRFEDLELLCVGGGAFTSAERSLLARLPSSITITQEDVTDDRLSELYRSSAVLVSTSMAEGFGLPALEAMAAGCPVILSDIPVYREVAGSAARYFDVDDAKGLSAQLSELLNHAELRQQLGSLGWQRSQLFTWRKMAEQTARAYQLISG